MGSSCSVQVCPEASSEWSCTTYPRQHSSRYFAFMHACTHWRCIYWEIDGEGEGRRYNHLMETSLSFISISFHEGTTSFFSSTIVSLKDSVCDFMCHHQSSPLALSFTSLPSHFLLVCTLLYTFTSIPSRLRNPPPFISLSSRFLLPLHTPSFSSRRMTRTWPTWPSMRMDPD